MQSGFFLSFFKADNITVLPIFFIHIQGGAFNTVARHNDRKQHVYKQKKSTHMKRTISTNYILRREVDELETHLIVSKTYIRCGDGQRISIREAH